MARVKKVLLIGAGGLAGAQSVDWLSGELPNIADFDVAVVNELALAEQMRLRRTQTIEQAQSTQKRLEALGRGLFRLLRSDGSIYAIIVPAARAEYWDKDRNQPSSLWEQTSHQWMPLPVEITQETGDTIEDVAEEFDRYFRSVASWWLTFRPPREKEKLDEVLERHDRSLLSRSDVACEVDVRPLARNREGGYVAAKASYSILESMWPSPEFQVAYRSGQLNLLPLPTAVSVDEAIRVVLEDFCGVPTRQLPPTWVTLIQMPGARDLDASIEQTKKEIERLQAELDPLTSERQRRESFKALVYETGVSLQETVESAFRELGLLTRPSDVSDEFIVESHGQQLLVEVKGNEKSAKLTDLRQLLDCQLEHEQKHDASIKSALIVDAWRSIAPSQRGGKEAPVFPDNVVKRAQDNDIALLDTVDLYAALNLFWLGNLSGEDVFESLFEGRGAVRLITDAP